MKTKTTLFIMIALLSASVIYSAIIYPHLPAVVPTHWNIHGQPDQWGNKAIDVWLVPGLIAGMILLYLALPALSPKNYKIEPFRETYNEIMLLVVGLFAYVHLVLVQAALHPYTDMGRVLIAGMLFFIAAMGNFMGKVRRNFWMGIRTPWTLASEAVWVSTHRLAGRLMVAAGIFGGAAALLGAPVMWLFFLLMAAMLYPCLHSLILYKRLERTGTV